MRRDIVLAEPLVYWDDAWKVIDADYEVVPVREPFFNISTRKVGGLRFVKIGRFCFSFCVTKIYRSL